MSFFLCVLNCDTAPDATYILPRGDGTVILGGTFDHGNGSIEVDHAVTQSILTRCSTIIPQLKTLTSSQILNHSVGLRPFRKGSQRVEVDKVLTSKLDTVILHVSEMIE